MIKHNFYSIGSQYIRESFPKVSTWKVESAQALHAQLPSTYCLNRLFEPIPYQTNMPTNFQFPILSPYSNFKA